MPTLLKVAILMGSRSDLDTMKAATKELDEFGVPYEMKALSAHRSPDAVKEFVESATLRGARVFIAGAGVAAHLAGAVAAQTAYPVIGVPIGSSKLGGMDSLLSTVQMPPGVPVATVAIDNAKNAGILALQMLSIEDADLHSRLVDEKERMARNVVANSNI